MRNIISAHHPYPQRVTLVFPPSKKLRMAILMLLILLLTGVFTQV